VLFPRRQTWIPLTSASEWLKAVHGTCWNPSALHVYIYTLYYILLCISVYIYIYMMNDYVCLYITIICNYICIHGIYINSINRLLFVYTCDPVIVSEHCMTRSYRHIGAAARCDVVGIRLISEPLNRAPKNPFNVIFDHPMYTYICIDK
jgi:hypothetical protein